MLNRVRSKVTAKLLLSLYTEIADVDITLLKLNL